MHEVFPDALGSLVRADENFQKAHRAGPSGQRDYAEHLPRGRSRRAFGGESCVSVGHSEDLKEWPEPPVESIGRQEFVESARRMDFYKVETTPGQFLADT